MFIRVFLRYEIKRLKDSSGAFSPPQMSSNEWDEFNDRKAWRQGVIYEMATSTDTAAFVESLEEISDWNMWKSRHSAVWYYIKQT